MTNKIWCEVPWVPSLTSAYKERTCSSSHTHHQANWAEPPREADNVLLVDPARLPVAAFAVASLLLLLIVET